ADDVMVLTNEDATRDGILTAFDRLIAGTPLDAVVLVHYAGHGSQITDREGDEPSGFDSTIVTIDSEHGTGVNRDITDHEIQLKLEVLAEKSSHIVLIFDACHSGTMTRDVAGTRVRGADPDTRPVTELPPSPIPPSREPHTSGPSGWLPLAHSYV